MTDTTGRFGVNQATGKVSEYVPPNVDILTTIPVVSVGPETTITEGNDLTTGTVYRVVSGTLQATDGDAVVQVVTGVP